MSQDFWRTAISKVEPNRIEVRGYDMQSLIREGSFGDIVYLLFKGEWPRRGEGRLVEAILVSTCDHSLAAPSTDATRLVASCGVPLPSAVAAGLLGIGDYHGGAIEGCARTLAEGLPNPEDDLAAAADRLVASVRGNGERFLGYGHPLHQEDPRGSAASGDRRGAGTGEPLGPVRAADRARPRTASGAAAAAQRRRGDCRPAARNGDGLAPGQSLLFDFTGSRPLRPLPGAGNPRTAV